MTDGSINGQGTSVETTDRAGRLSAAKRALLELRLKKGAQSPRPVGVARRAAPGPVPLSHAQELLWLLDQLNPNMSVYSVPRAMRISGPLNVAALRQTLDTIVERHEVLRTTFQVANGQPVQVVEPSRPLSFPEIDLSSLPASARETEVQRLLTEEARRPFDLSRDLMLRALLLKLSDDEHAFYIGSHHIASDGWSKSVLFAEMKALYESYCAGCPSPLPELPIQYADFALWQRQWLQGEVVDQQLAYWKDRLAGAPNLMQLPCDYSRPAVQTFRGSFRRVVFPIPLLEAFKALSQNEQATLFMTLLAATSVLLGRFTGQDDVLMGTPIAGRDRPETEGLIGYFTNTLVLRTDLSGDPTFRELIRRVRDDVLSAFDHQDLPFEKLVVEMKPERDLSFSPIFQVLFSVGHVGAMVPELPGLRVEPVALDRGITKFDLLFGLTERSDGLAVGCEYNTDLFKGETIGRLLERYQGLLEAIVAQPDQRLSQLPMLTEAERRQVVVEWNNTTTEFPKDACIHDLIEAQVERTPDAVAVVHQGQELTYRELNARANQLAHYLRRRGIGPDGLVAIAVDRSPEMTVGLLGVLKAGGAYVPLDPSYPKERLAAMLDDARPRVLLTQERLASQLPLHAAEVIRLDSNWPTIAQESTANPERNTTPENLAYVIYTSGSTGTPRGVQITHQGLVNHNLAAVAEYGFGPADRILQFSSLSFDIAVEEIFPCWISGATLVLRAENTLMSGLDFLGWIKRERITVLDLPTAYWHEWVHEMALTKAKLPETLRLVIVGGEKALAGAYSTWRKLAGDRVRWINTYGPTEATVVATWFDPQKSPGFELDGRELPIGRPIANTRVYILDRALQPAPVGLPGELHIGGAGVARGYLNRPQLTQEKFVPDPFSEQRDARLYKTGDLARFLPDGNIEFLGRADFQVKIRGFRIELGEIEAVLGSHPAVREAMVLAREDAPGEKRLVAYVVPNAVAAPSADLRSYLKEKLPEYMVPTAFVSLTSFPKTPNGKVDRRALPAPEPARSAMRAESAVRHDPVELELTMLWESLLGVKSIGRDENFFDLGGHSLLAVRLFAQIEQVFGKRLPLAALFQAPTIEQLAEVLRKDADSHSWPTMIPIQPLGGRPPFFCVAAPNVNALGYAFLARHLGQDQPLYGLQSPFREQSEGPYTQTEYEALARDYLATMRTVQPEGPYYLGGMCEGAHIAFEMARQLDAQEQEVGLLAVLDAWPTENTISPFFWAVRHYLKLLRAFQQMGMAERLRFLLGKAKGVLWKKGSTLLPKPARRGPEDAFHARVWPGKDFVPPQFSGKITLFRTRRQPYWRVWDYRNGWGSRALGGVEVHLIPGNHATILREPDVQVLARQLEECLLKAREAAGEIATIATGIA